MWSSLSIKQKVAGAAFVVAKVQSILTVVTLFVNPRLAILFCTLAGLGIACTVAFALWDSKEKKHRICKLSDAQVRAVLENNPSLLAAVEARV